VPDAVGKLGQLKAERLAVDDEALTGPGVGDVPAAGFSPKRQGRQHLACEVDARRADGHAEQPRPAGAAHALP
jgi:hypothetical protein